MKRYPTGSEWRKWDLHVHLPSNRMSNHFQTADGSVDWSRFCSVLEESDVFGFGLTDYFNVDAFFDFRREFETKYPKSEKVFFPVVEIRLNEAVNKAREDVNFHILFRPDETQERINSFLRALKTESTTPDGRQLSCFELESKSQLEGASVTRRAVDEAYEAAFGKSPRVDNILTIAPSNNDGIRADSTNQRKRGLADQIDKMADLIFGNGTNTQWFLNKNRFEEGAGVSRPKPVVTGSDAHNYDDLLSWLGRTAPAPNEKYVTWIKGDLTYEGLQQTLIEPEARVRIGDAKPDFKEPYRYIEKIVFESSDFPSEVRFNPNLTSIIGSRSSGKSALLAYVAHAVDPEHTLDQQAAVSPMSKRTDLGPAAGHTWDSVSSLKRHVVWGNPEAKTGQIIYVPQNSLYEISTRPGEITDKIRPALLRAYPDLERDFETFESQREDNRLLLAQRISAWFAHTAAVGTKTKELAQLGDKDAIQGAATSIAGEIHDLRTASSLTDAEHEEHTQAKASIARNAETAERLSAELEELARFVRITDESEMEASDQVAVTIATDPPAHLLGEGLGARVETLRQAAEKKLVGELRILILEHYVNIDRERQRLLDEIAVLTEEHQALFAKFAELAATADLEKRLEAHKLTLSNIEAEETQIAEERASAAQNAKTLVDLIGERDAIYERLRHAFERESRTLESMTFGLAIGTSTDELELLSQSFNKQASTEFLSSDRQRIELERIVAAPLELLCALESGTQRIRQGEEAKTTAIRVLTSLPEVRLTATLEGDSVGGFAIPTMTPGKQALFALTLILSESNEPWPLLLDQPEDDLDSRSIYEVIVPYLAARKSERQVIMVSHNANLVVGADSESVVVANRHGEDRQNRDGKRFDYKSGSLEHSVPQSGSPIILESRGISEHACEILDGGTDAFEKRKNKYNIKWG